MKPGLRLGVVGCGEIAAYTAWLARLNRGLALAACCDRDLEKAQRFARRFHIPEVYHDYTHLLEREKLDALYLAVPHHLHAPMLAQAIEYRLPVLVEKPLARTLEEGQQALNLAQSSGVKIGVNYQYRYDAGCYTLARAVQQGALGQIYYARLNLAWRRDQSYFQNASWHARLETAGGGTLITQGSHLLDVAMWALAEAPRQAWGSTARLKFLQVEVEDLAQATLELASGALVEISTSMLSASEQPLSIEVYGEHGSAFYSDRPWPRVRFLGVRPPAAHLPVPGFHALQRSLEGFRRWVLDETPYLIPAQEALPVLAAVDAIYRSARSGCKEAIAAV